MSNQIFQYNGNPITFQIGEATMVNATEMAKPFGDGKRAKNWLILNSTNEFLSVLSKGRNLPLADLVQVTKGGSNPGTWFHEDVALEFARWLSPAFAIWCNDRIKELFKHGITATPNVLESALNDPDALIRALQELKNARVKVSSLENEIAEMMSVGATAQTEIHAPNILIHNDTQRTYTTKEVAKELGMTAQQLNRALEAKHIVERVGGNCAITSEYAEKGYMVLKGYPYRDRSNPKRERLNYWAVWTESGYRFLISLFTGQKRLL